MTWTLERIYARCTPDDGCQLWDGFMKDGRYPIACEPDPSRASGQRHVLVRRVVYELAKGRAAPAAPHYVLVARCKDPRCVAEDCLQVQSRGKRLEEAAATGVFQSPAHRAKIAAGRRRKSDLSDEAVDALRTSDEPMPVLAARFGISKGYGYAIRAGRNRRDYSSPLAGLVPVQSRRS